MGRGREPLNFGRQKVEGLQKGEPSLSWSMGKTNANPDDAGGQDGKTSQEVQQWANLLEVLQAAPIHNMVAKQAELLEIMEKLKDTVRRHTPVLAAGAHV